MDLTGAHERSVQVVGNGYIETRQFWFSPSGEFVLAMVTVVLTDDGSSTNLVGTNQGGVISVDGHVRYPDDTFLIAGFSVDGRATISHARPNSNDSTHWHYTPDGYAEVSQTEHGTGSLVSTFWQVGPDGAPFGDVREYTLIALPDGVKEIDTLRQRDGTVTTTTKVFSQGEVLSDETTVVHFETNPELPPADGKVPTRPSTGSGGGAGGLEPTTRTPDPKVSSGGGWQGSGGASVEHITDWWYRGVGGRTLYLGSTTDAKTKEA